MGCGQGADGVNAFMQRVEGDVWTGQNVLGTHRVFQGRGFHSIQDGLRLVRGHAEFFQLLAQGSNPTEFGVERSHARVAGKAQFMGQRGQAFVRIVLSEQNAVFSP